MQVLSKFQKMPICRHCSMFLLVVASIAISSMAASAQVYSINGCWEAPVRGIQVKGQASQLLSSEFELPELRGWCSTPGTRPRSKHYCGHSKLVCCCLIGQ